MRSISHTARQIPNTVPEQKRIAQAIVCTIELERVNPLQGACLEAQAREVPPRRVEEIRRDAERGGERLLLTSIVDPQNASQRHSALRSAMRGTDGSDGFANVLKPNGMLAATTSSPFENLRRIFSARARLVGITFDASSHKTYVTEQSQARPSPGPCRP